VVLEYAFGTERPVLFIDVPFQVRNERYKDYGLEVFELSIRKMIGEIISPDNLEKVPEVIEKLIIEKDKYKNSIKKLRENSIFSFGRSSEAGAEHIMGLLEHNQ
ncbi:hypothetical protein ACFL6D_05590, partial [Spirochaetota bacterium]